MGVSSAPMAAEKHAGYKNGELETLMQQRVYAQNIFQNGPTTNIPLEFRYGVGTGLLAYTELI